MTALTTAIKFDTTDDGVYDLDATGKVMSAKFGRGRRADRSQAAPGRCTLVLNNDAGTFSPRNSGLRPLYGVQIVSEGQDLFTGFISRVFQHPEPSRREVIVECGDWLWWLSRTDVKMPLMRDVLSNIFIHRIADAAEVGELVANPRFADDLTGYTDLGAGTGVRVTTGHVQEGAGVLDITGLTGSADGVRYALPHDADADLQGVAVTAAVYIWSEDEADVGENVHIRLADSVGNGAAGTLTLTAYPQRVIASRTFDGAATDFYIDITGSAAAGAEAMRVGAVHCVPTVNAIPRIDALVRGGSTFAQAAPHRVKALGAMQKAAQNELGGLVFVDGSGNLRIEAQSARWFNTPSTVVQGTFDETMVSMPLAEDASDRVGLVELGYAVWEEGDAGTVVFTLAPVPRAIGPNETITIHIDYGAEMRAVAAPVANSDYFIRSLPDGDGAGVDETGNVTVAIDNLGSGADITLASSVARATFLTNLQVTATPTRQASDHPLVTYTPSGAPRLPSKLRYDYTLQSTPAKVQTWAEYLGDRYVTQRERLPVTVLNATAALTAQQAARVIGDRVALVNDNKDYSLKVNGDYYIDAITWALSDGRKKLVTVWECVPVDLDYAIWDVDDWDDAGAPWAP